MASCSSPSLCTHTRCVTGCRPPSCWEQPRRTCCHGGSGASFPAFYQRDCTTSWTTGCITSTRVWFSSSLRTTLELRLVTADFVHVNYSHSDCCRHSRVARVCVNCGTHTHPPEARIWQYLDRRGAVQARLHSFPFVLPHLVELVKLPVKVCTSLKWYV